MLREICVQDNINSQENPYEGCAENKKCNLNLEVKGDDNEYTRVVEFEGEFELVFNRNGRSVGDYSSSNWNITEGFKSSCNFTVYYTWDTQINPERISEVRQGNNFDCWLAAATLLLSYRDQQTYTFDSVLEMAGGDFKEAYQNSDRVDITSEGIQIFSDRVGLEVETQTQDYSASELTEMLDKYGPFIITSNWYYQTIPDAFLLHACVVTGIINTGNDSTSSINYYDPLVGSTGAVKVEDFNQMFATIQYHPKILRLPLNCYRNQLKVTGEGRLTSQGIVNRTGFSEYSDEQGTERKSEDDQFESEVSMEILVEKEVVKLEVYYASECFNFLGAFDPPLVGVQY